MSNSPSTSLHDALVQVLAQRQAARTAKTRLAQLAHLSTAEAILADYVTRRAA